MVTFELFKENSKFNDKEVYVLANSEEDIIQIGDAFSTVGVTCRLYNDMEEQDLSGKKTMLLVDDKLLERMKNDGALEKNDHYVFSFSRTEDMNDTKGREGHISLPIEENDIEQILNVCHQKSHYDGVIEKMDQHNMALEKVSSLGRFTGSLVHDLNNYNTICMTAFDGLKLVNRKKYQDEKIDFLVSKGLKGCKMINSISTKYRKFMFVTDNSEKQFFNLNKLVNESFDYLEKDLNQYGITFKIEVPNTMQVLCNESSFIQVLVNLVSNAIYEIKNQESPWVSIKARSKKSGVFLYVIDSGKGISQEIQDKIFDPLFSTKTKNDGTGFGLSFCKRELENMGMNIRYVDHENTAFAVEIPSSIIKFTI